MSAKAGARAGYHMSCAEPQVAELPIWSTPTQLSLGLLSWASRLSVGEATFLGTLPATFSTTIACPPTRHFPHPSVDNASSQALHCIRTDNIYHSDLHDVLMVYMMLEHTLNYQHLIDSSR